MRVAGAGARARGGSGVARLSVQGGNRFFCFGLIVVGCPWSISVDRYVCVCVWPRYLDGLPVRQNSMTICFFCSFGLCQRSTFVNFCRVEVCVCVLKILPRSIDSLSNERGELLIICWRPSSTAVHPYHAARESVEKVRLPNTRGGTSPKKLAASFKF